MVLGKDSISLSVMVKTSMIKDAFIYTYNIPLLNHKGHRHAPWLSESKPWTQSKSSTLVFAFPLFPCGRFSWSLPLGITGAEECGGWSIPLFVPELLCTAPISRVPGTQFSLSESLPDDVLLWPDFCFRKSSSAVSPSELWRRAIDEWALDNIALLNLFCRVLFDANGCNLLPLTDLTSPIALAADPVASSSAREAKADLADLSQ